MNVESTKKCLVAAEDIIENTKTKFSFKNIKQTCKNIKTPEEIKIVLMILEKRNSKIEILQKILAKDKHISKIFKVLHKITKAVLAVLNFSFVGLILTVAGSILKIIVSCIGKKVEEMHTRISEMILTLKNKLPKNT